MKRTEQIKPDHQGYSVPKFVVFGTALLLVLSVSGMWLNFIPTKTFANKCNAFSITLSFIILLYLMFYYKEFKEIDFRTRLTNSTLISIVYFILLNITITYSVPYIMLWQNLNTDIIKYKITGVVDGPWYEMSGCQHFITVYFGSIYKDSKVCLSAKEISAYHRDLEVSITEIITPYGIKILNTETF